MRALTLALLIAAPPAAPATPGESPSLALQKALFDYAQAEYEAVVSRLGPLLEPVQFDNETELAQARKTLGGAFFLLDKPERARAEFALLLLADPDAQLDPYSTAPPILRFFAQVRDEQGNAAREAHRLYLERKRHFEAPRLFERTVVRRSQLLCFLPFGVGQFQNGQVGLGAMYLSIEVVMLGANILGYVMHQLIANNEGSIKAADAWKSTAWLVTQYAGLGGFLASWAIGAIHARLQFEPYYSVDFKEVAPQKGPHTQAGMNLRLTF